MGKLYDSDKHGGGEPHVKVHEKDSNLDHVRGDKYTDTGGGKHTHDGYTVSRGTGNYREYHGGENSSDRSHNKGK